MTATPSPLTGALPQPVNVHNASGARINGRSLVYIDGFDTTTGLFTIGLADNSVQGAVAQYLLAADLADGESGVAYPEGQLSGIDTHNVTTGAPVYLSTSGQITLTAPDASVITQIVGFVQTSDVQGTIWVAFYGNLGAVAPFTPEGLNLLPLTKWVYDATVDSGAIGTVAMRGPQLPVNAIAVAGFMEVITSPVGSGASIAIQLQAANDVVAAAAISGAPWSTGGIKAIVPVWSDMTKAIKVTSSAKTPSLVITSHLLSTGKINLFLALGLADG